MTLLISEDAVFSMAFFYTTHLCVTQICPPAEQAKPGPVKSQCVFLKSQIIPLQTATHF